MNKGILYIILSGLSFMVVNFFVKILGVNNEHDFFGDLQAYPGHELVLARSLVSFSISFYIVRKQGLPTFGNNPRWLLIRGISGTIALTIFFYTLHYLPLAVATTVQYLSPIFTILLAVYILKEKVRLLQWTFIIFSFSGVCLIALSKLLGKIELSDQISLFWLGMGMLSAAFSGVAYVAIMKLKKSDKPITIVMYFPMVAIPAMTVLCLYDFTLPKGIEWIILLLIGLFTQFAQILLTKALHEGDASVIMPFQYLGAIYSLLIGYFLFDERLSLLVNLGIGIVLLGVLINVVLRNK